jgi:polyketide biosynthesis 3-hydroxy-3-methylglutaryl-CoA synthase-like enzyme PksG
MAVGIEAIHPYGGKAFLDVRTLFAARGLDMSRFANLMMERKSVGLSCEDPVTNAVNAAKPIIDALSEDDKARIELVISASESGLDFGKAMATYVHEYLGLGRRCRTFEMKQACYAGTAGLQMASSWVAAGLAPGAKALVIATDTAGAAAKNTYAEPTQGSGAVAMLVSEQPDILALDLGANGYHSYEVMDTCRPAINFETGDPDLSLLSYLDCLEHSYHAYAEVTEGVDIQDTFDYLAFHTPFAGMVKGAHRMLMRKLKRLPPGDADLDFQRRVAPSLHYCVQVGNVYSATLYLALCGLVDQGDFRRPKRVGLYSYGSGCSAELFSGVVTARAQEKLGALGIEEALTRRHALTVPEYEAVLHACSEWGFGVKDKTVDLAPYAHIYARQFEGQGLLVLKRVNGYHREYDWS